MELGAHHIVVVACQDRDAAPALPVPDADGLVVRGGEDPWVLMVKHRGADVIQVAEQVEEATLLLVVPHLDLVVVPAGDKEGLLVVEADAPDRALVLVKLLQEGAHAVVPKLDHSVVQTGGRKSHQPSEGLRDTKGASPCENPWPLRVEGESLR